VRTLSLEVKFTLSMIQPSVVRTHGIESGMIRRAIAKTRDPPAITLPVAVLSGITFAITPDARTIVYGTTRRLDAAAGAEGEREGETVD
jgi:hypothetical protein